MSAYIRAFKTIFIFIVLILFSFQYVKAKDGVDELSEAWILKKAVKPPQDYFTTSKDDHYLHLVEYRHLNLTSKTLWPFIKAGEYYLAISDLFFVLRAFPNHPKALKLMGRLSTLLKHPWIALPWYEKALKLFPQHAYTHAQYGNYMAENSEDDIDMIKMGISKLKKALEMDPKLGKAYAWLANAYYKAGKSELALQAAKKAKVLGYKGKILDEIQKNNIQKKDK